MASSAGRFAEHGREILDWMTPLFSDETPAQRRIRYAACLLGDVFWSEHPDYRAKQAFFRTLRISFVGVEHPERARLAMALFTRYNGDEDDSAVRSAISMLTDEDLRRARAIGLALRLAHGLTGGVPDLVRKTALAVEGKTIVLSVPADDPALNGEVLDRPFDRLAKSVGCDTVEVRRVVG
jgi:exopolyphosphatase/guanosine-5'-triphosphate,3'-diphosphate pyrophosphatase